MKYCIGLYFLIIGTFVLKTLITERKNDKLKEQKVKDILGFNIVDGEVYDIEYLEEAELQMTSIQKENYTKNDIPIILQGKTRNVKNRDNNIEVEIVGNRSYYSTICRFVKDTNLLNTKVLQPIKVKGYLRLYGFSIMLEDCELVN